MKNKPKIPPTPHHTFLHIEANIKGSADIIEESLDQVDEVSLSVSILCSLEVQAETLDYPESGFWYDVKPMKKSEGNKITPVMDNLSALLFQKGKEFSNKKKQKLKNVFQVFQSIKNQLHGGSDYVE